MDLVARVERDISASTEAVFDFITSPDAPALTFVGHGPIPRALRSELVRGPLGVGAVRRLHNSDGSVIDEEFVEYERPRRQAYHLVRGVTAPVSWLIATPRAEWTLTAVDGGTHVQWTFHFPLRSPLAWPAAAVMRAAFRRAMEKCLAATAHQVEALDASRGAPPA